MPIARRPRQPQQDAPDPYELVGCEITALKPSPKDPFRLSVRVGRRSLGTVSSDDIAAIGLAVGDECSVELIDRVLAAADADKAKRQALRKIAARPKSRDELVSELKRSGRTDESANKAADDLERVGLIDDELFARELARQIVAKAPAGRRLLEHKLRQKKVRPELAREVAAETLESRSESDDALAYAESRARRMPKGIDRAAAQRRLFGALARRGFDAHAARDAVDRVLDQFGELDGGESI